MRIRTFITAAILSLLSFVSCSASRTVDKIRSSIVRIEATSPFGEQSVCTGFVIKKDTVLTDQHCLGTLMSADGYETKLIHADDYFDLAVLSTRTGKHPLYLRDYPTYTWEHLRGTGYAWGWSIPITMDQTVLIPNISPATRTAVGIITQGGYVGGMSGGPITDDLGDVVGIVQRSSSGTGYGVSSLIIRAFLLDAGIEVN